MRWMEARRDEEESEILEQYVAIAREEARSMIENSSLSLALVCGQHRIRKDQVRMVSISKPTFVYLHCCEALRVFCAPLQKSVRRQPSLALSVSADEICE